MNRQESALEVSVVMPCLNEAETLPACIQKAQEAIDMHDVQAEIVVADNGSHDGSPDIAVVRGTYVVMGDADRRRREPATESRRG